jgi:cytochrome c-type biogenesis protein CcmH/NrfG
MKLLSKTQWGVILGAVLLTLALYFAPKKQNETTNKPELSHQDHDHGDAEATLVAYKDSVKSLIDPNLLASIEKMEQDAQNERLAKDQVMLYDSIANLWKKTGQPVMAAEYANLAAEKSGKAEKWALAGRYYYVAFNFTRLSDLRPLLIDKSISAYTRAMELNPKNLSYKTQLGTCLVEGSSNPMQGISYLREVLKEDSLNLEAHMQLGVFAIKSKQYDKAVNRFTTVLKIKPDYLEAYLYLGESQANMGKKEEAIKTLEKFKSLSNDTLITAEVDQFIKQLKNN